MTTRMLAVACLSVVVLAAGCGKTQMNYGCPTSPEGVHPAIVGSQVPNQAVVSPEGKEVQLRDVFAAKPTVLVVYRGDWCVYCQKQLAQMQEIEPDLMRLGYQVVAISPDTPANLKKSIVGRNLKYQLFSDTRGDVMKALGLAYSIDETTQRAIDRDGPTLTGASAQPLYMLPVPAVFIVNRGGVIRFEHIDPDYRQRVDPQLIMAAARCLVEHL